MQIREFSAPVTSKQINESLAKKFGFKINLEQFATEQLEDARNKLRTKISQFEMNESFDSVLENPEYQKTRMFLDCINAAIMEREASIQEGVCDDCGESPCECDHEDHDDKKESKMESKSYTAFIRNRGSRLSVPDSWINSAIKRIELGESDRAELKAELKLRYDLNESQASWMLLEGEEDKAEIIMATKDMVDRITGWLEDVAAMKAEQLLELLDSIRAQQGSDVAQQYQEAVKPALEAIYTALETSRQGLSGALAIVSGGEAPTMGAPAGAMGGMDQAAAGLDAEVGSIAPPAPGEEGEMPGEEETPPAPEVGRAKRESVDYSRRLGLLLNSKKK
jgi:hypothetical protein